MDLQVVMYAICGFYATLVNAQFTTTQGPHYQDSYVYLLGFMNITMDNSQMRGFQQIMISSPQDTYVRVEIPYLGLNEYFTLAGGNRSWERIIEADLVTAKDDGPRNRAIRITSTKQVTVHAVKSKQATTDGFLALPITENAKEFYVVSAAPQPAEHSAFVIAALFPDTCIEAYKRIGSSLVKLRGLISLNEFDIYQFESGSIDMTGVYINSSKPIAVFAGHECAWEPLFISFCDHTVAQVPPVSEWGSVFNVPSIEGRRSDAGYVLRVVAAYDRTDVEVEVNNKRYRLDQGQYLYENLTDSTTHTRVVCSKPCLVTQHNRSWRYRPSDTQTDSFMILVPPVDHYVNHMTFRTGKFWDNGDYYNFGRNYLGLVVPARQTNKILLDGKVVNPNWSSSGSGYKMATLDVNPGFHTINTGNRTGSEMMAFVYGHAIAVPTGYGYPLGYKLNGARVTGPWNYYMTPPPVVLGPCIINTGTARGLDLMYGLSFKLLYQVDSLCASQYRTILESQLAGVLNGVNDLICHGVVCGGTQGSAVAELNINWQQNGMSLVGMDVDIIITTSIDDLPSEVYSCRKDVMDKVANGAWWNLPQAVPGCNPLYFSAVTARNNGRGTWGTHGSYDDGILKC